MRQHKASLARQTHQMGDRAMKKRSELMETFGEVFPHLLIEAVVDPEHPGQLLLQSWNGRQSTMLKRVCYRGRTYVPAPIKAGLTQAVRFPPVSRSYGSVANLVSPIRQVFIRYAGAPADVASVLAAFSMASYVVDCLPTAPTIYLFGPENEVSLVLRLLGCTCRRPVLLGDVDMAALATLPAQLGATLLVNQRDLGRGITRVLQASCNRRFRIARGKRALDLYGAKAFSADAGSVEGQGIEVCIAPFPRPLPLLTEAAEGKIAAEIQPRLLQYRTVYHRRVRNAKVDCEKFIPLTCEEVQAWLAPICDCPDLCEAVTNYLLERSREAAGNRFIDLKCLVTEGALSFCHEPECREFYVGELCVRVNALLKGRHENAELKDRKVGAVLRRNLGIRAERDTAGYRVELTDNIRERIHALARSYRVLSLQDGVARCPQCTQAYTVQLNPASGGV
jgi:hypothetical protein